MSTRFLKQIFISVSALGLVLGASHAQTTTQSLNMKPGWNAIYLEVQPEPSDCDTVFGDLPVESVWFWNGRYSSVQFIQDADELEPGGPTWAPQIAHICRKSAGKPPMKFDDVQLSFARGCLDF